MESNDLILSSSDNTHDLHSHAKDEKQSEDIAHLTFAKNYWINLRIYVSNDNLIGKISNIKYFQKKLYLNLPYLPVYLNKTLIVRLPTDNCVC